MKQTLESFLLTPASSWGAEPKARLSADVPFQASTGEVHPAGEENYEEITLTASGDGFTFPDTELDTTDDSSNPNATYTLKIFDGRKEVYTAFERWAFTASWGDSVDWARLEAFNVNRAPLRDDQSYSKRQTDLLVTGLYAPDARTNVAGKGYASVNPASGAPTFLTTEDTSVVFTTDERLATIGVWNHAGIIKSASIPEHEENVGEPCPDYGPPVYLVGSGFANVWKMWNTGGWDNPNIYYSESPDEQEWFDYPTPVITNASRPCIFEANGVRHAFYSPGTTGLSIVHATSTNDGLSFSSPQTVITRGSLGAWDSVMVANCTVILDGLNGLMLYDGYNGVHWGIGLATSSDGGTTWSKYAGNPVMSRSGLDGVAQPDFHKIGDDYYAWPQVMIGGITPCDVYRYKADASLHNWTPTALPTFPRTTQDEGVGNNVGQITGRLIEVDGRVHFYYTADVDGMHRSGGSHIKLAIFDGTLEQLVQTQEGIKLPTTAVSTLSARIGSGVRDGVRTHRTTNQSIPYNTPTPVSFTVNAQQDGSIHSTTVNTSRFDAATDCKVNLYSTVFYAGNSVGLCQLFAVKTGAETVYLDFDQEPCFADGNALHVMVMDYRMAAGESLEVYAFHTAKDGGGNPISLNLQATNNRIPGAAFQVVSK